MMLFTKECISLGVFSPDEIPQMCLALRYLHKEKRIVHRDLTPNNVMLGERDKVTISQSITVVLFMLYFSLLMASSTKTRVTRKYE